MSKKTFVLARIFLSSVEKFTELSYNEYDKRPE